MANGILVGAYGGSIPLDYLYSDGGKVHVNRVNVHFVLV